MALDTQVGIINLNTSTGDQVIPCNFKAKVIFFYPTIETADGIAGHFAGNYGVATQDLEQFALAVTDEDGEPTTDTTRVLTMTDCIIALDQGENTFLYRASLTAIGDTSFTINISVAPASAYRVAFLALGGSDIDETKIGQFDAPGSTTQSSITGVGFEPKFLQTTFISSASLPANGANLHVGLGAAKSILESGAIGITSQNGVGTSNTRRAQRTQSLLHKHNVNGALNTEAYLVSLDDDGFTLDFTTSTGLRTVAYLALNGPIRLAVGSFNSQLSTGEFPTTSIGFQGVAGLFWSWNRASDSGTQTGAELSLGMVDDEGNQFAVGDISEHNVGTTNTDHWSDDGLIYQNYDNAQTQEGAIDFTSWDSDGFTLNQTDADPTANEILYIIFGSTPPVSSVTIIPDQRPCSN